MVPRRGASWWRCATRTTAGIRTSSRCCATRSGDAQLAYSDQRLVDARRPRAARDAVERAAQQPHEPRLAAGRQHGRRGGHRCSAARWPSWRCRSRTRPGCQFHDHWLGARRARRAASSPTSTGRSTTTSSTRGAVFGDVSRGPRGRRPAAMRRIRSWRAAYFHGYCRPRGPGPRHCSCAARERLTAPKRRALRRFVAGARSPAALRLARRTPAARAGRPQRDARQRVRARAGNPVAPPGRRSAPRSRRGRLRRQRFLRPGSFDQKRLRRWRARLTEAFRAPRDAECRLQYSLQSAAFGLEDNGPRGRRGPLA